MPWLTILLALLSFFSAKKSGASNTKALLTAGLVGAGTYYVTHETDWGSANLGSLDGVVTDSSGQVVTENGAPVLDPVTGLPVKTTLPSLGQVTSTTSGSGVWDTLKSWGATGTAAVLGTAGVATGAISLSSLLPIVLLVGGFLILKG